jgi:hypothetical protein
MIISSLPLAPMMETPEASTSTQDFDRSRRQAATCTIGATSFLNGLEGTGWVSTHPPDKQFVVADGYWTNSFFYNSTQQLCTTGWIALSRSQGWSARTPPSVSKYMQGNGRATLNYGNCWKTGTAFVELNGRNIQTAGKWSDVSISFVFKDGDQLSVRDDGKAVINLKQFTIDECGKCSYLSPSCVRASDAFQP